ncbi:MULTISPECIES: sensor domain-containing diguanylate cyclase [unclassified Paenibacillus]|uniref:sensor domain-containing diguanylate cyclase n=1 Tax=unclassified Paenibacillus TaxID=185978 RepID=UPI0024054197|nr:MULTISPECIES: sensor domain-containing diguanylate cyclase [unclassified Paenibacillus]MDF9843888.1 diguanylate cyclase (GGDEF)-like protein/PAS domain S-box-containing protein [Paenibacillus sp. PastF-2]MDF9850428.1 diguanylate cyclase (GGDEF)-like protein/PAS domain S-box-containing protein [Paenibacillus sp. PastM-2]MDF9857067.1 diguanylate cyclase (GGDEF)-like protein/PAS domain S-box-containing protein [Paenibacillus sp. PastF-1]MDH6482339.1 diguanylate cyclase (GGDEF)-like protein/PAS 
MAGLSKNNNTRRLIIVFAAIPVLLVVISTASLLYLNATMNRLSDSLYSDVYQNSELILNADRDLYQGAVSLHAAMSPNITSEQRSLFAQDFEDNNSQIRQRLTMASYNINNLDNPYSGMKQSELLLSELKDKLASFESSMETWKDTGRDLISRRVQSDWNPDSFSATLINTQLTETRSSLDEAENLIGNYAQQITLEFREKKSALFAVYSLFLFLLILVIIYLCRRLISLQNQMLEEKSLYQLIGETMSDFIILTDPNGLILYASPSHAGVLGYVPEKGSPLTNYIREAEISWAKLKSAVQGSPRISELRMRSSEGHWVWLETKVSPISGSKVFPAQFMLISREITQRKQYEERLHKLAFYDHLTAIPNRAHFKMYMENLITQPEERRQEIALALLDCDRFKQLNDTLGHLAGDEFLQLLSRELQQTVKGTGQAFRIGGDEFAVVLHRFTSPEMLDEILQRLLQLFNKTWSVNNGSSFHTSASIGVALYPQHGSSINELLRAADLAMYRSKNRGGNEASLYNELIDEEVSDQTK